MIPLPPLSILRPEPIIPTVQPAPVAKLSPIVSQSALQQLAQTAEEAKVASETATLQPSHSTGPQQEEPEPAFPQLFHGDSVSRYYSARIIPD